MATDREKDFESEQLLRMQKFGGLIDRGAAMLKFKARTACNYLIQISSAVTYLKPALTVPVELNKSALQ